jgi:hypothetical protein
MFFLCFGMNISKALCVADALTHSLTHSLTHPGPHSLFSPDTTAAFALVQAALPRVTVVSLVSE